MHALARLLLMLANAAVCMPLLGASADVLSPEIALELRSASDVALSPDGMQVVYRLDRPRTPDEPLGGGVGELWSVDVAGGTPRKLTDTGFDAKQPRWSADGRQIAWLARSLAGNSPQVHVRTLDGAVSVLTDAGGGVEQFAWAPDSTRIAYTAWDGKTPERVGAEREGRDWLVFGETDEHLRLYATDLRSRVATLVTRAPLTVRYFDWSPDGTRFVIAAAPSVSEDDRLLRLQPYIVAAGGGVPTLLAEHFGRLTHTCWSADGKWIAWLASTAVTDPWAGTAFVAPADGSGQARQLTAGYEGTAVWLGTRPGKAASVALLAEERQSTALYELDLTTGQRKLLSAPKEILNGPPSFTRDGRALATAAHAPTHPNEVFFARTDRRAALRRLTQSNPSLAGLTLGEQTVTSWKSRDGLTIEGVLIKPVGYRPDTRYPVIVHVHGGSESVVLNGWQGSYRDWGQLLAARGYVTLYPNYRGSRGRGTDFIAGNRRDVMGREFEDIVSGLDHVVQLGLADAARAGIYGFSWGGYAAGWGATFGSRLFKAAVAGAGIYNWISVAGSNDTRMHEQIAHWDAPLYEHFPLYLQRSPVYEIRKANTPTLLLHGELDESCPLGQAIEFHTALKWKGVPVELVIYPREGHGMAERAHQLDFVTRGLGWFDRYLRASR